MVDSLVQEGAVEQFERKELVDFDGVVAETARVRVHQPL
jgi:hypothetical protein